jgi:hypothetical protein
MSNQGYFPTNEAERSVWLAHFRTKLPVHRVELGFSLDEVNSTLADIDFYIWLVQSWNPAVQKNAVEASAFKALIGTGSGSELVALPVHVVFDPEPVPVLPGVLTRLFNLIQRIKMATTYNLVVGKDLGIIGTQSTADSDVPDFTVTTERGPTIERVKLNFTKYSHGGVVVESRRNNGEWEVLGIVVTKPWYDERALLVDTVPEVREYRLRWWDKGEANGEYTAVQKVTVAP